MYQIDLKDTDSQLAKLIEEAARGEEVIIKGNDGNSFMLVPIASVNMTPKFGSAAGSIKISEDFDEPLEEFETYAP